MTPSRRTGTHYNTMTRTLFDCLSEPFQEQQLWTNSIGSCPKQFTERRLGTNSGLRVLFYRLFNEFTVDINFCLSYVLDMLQELHSISVSSFNPHTTP